MAEPLLQYSFAGGELSPDMYGRVDLSHYDIGVNLARNFFLDYHGGMSNRTGTELMSAVKDHARKVALIPFAFSTVETYMLEFGHQYMRVYRNGGIVLESGVTVTNITQANPADVTTNSAHGYSTGDQVFISGVEGMLRVNGGPHTITVTSATAFTIDGMDSTGFDAYTSGGTVSRVYEIATPYVEADLDRIKYTQSADVMTLTHPGYAQRELTRTGHTSWTMSTITFANTVSVPANLTSAKNGFSATGHTVRYKVTAIVDGEESLPSSETSEDVEYPWPSGGRVDLTWDSVTGADKYAVYANKNGYWGFIGESENDGGGAGAESFLDDNIRPEITDAPPADRDPFSGTDDKPQTVTYHQQRIVYAGAENWPAGIEMSQIGFFKNFARSVPAKSDDAISYSIVSRQVNEIRHLISLGGLIALTSDGEWLLTSGEKAEVTPATVGSDAESYEGASHVIPVVIGKTALYVENGGQTVRDLAYSLDVDGFQGTDLTVRSSHLFKDREIVSWAFAKRPYRLVWAVTDDGKLFTLTYVRDQKVWAWTQHETDGWFESVASVREGKEDAVYFAVRRTIGGNTRRFVERLHSRRFTEVLDAFFVDSGLSYDGRNTDTGITLTLSGGSTWDYFEQVTLTLAGDTWTPRIVGDRFRLRREGENVEVEVVSHDSSTTATVRLLADCPTELQGQTTSDWDQAVDVLLGLDHLEGETLNVLADGNVDPQVTVQDGSITIARHAAVIHAGLPYNADLRTLDIEITDGRSSVRTRPKLVGKISLLVKDTRGLLMGQDEDHLQERKPTIPSEYGASIKAVTGIVEASVPGAWDNQAGVYVRQSDPLPCTILSAIPEVSFGG